MASSFNFYSVMVGYNKFYIDRRYTDLKPCGDGSYGFVASALDTVTGEHVAIKKIKDAFSDNIDAKRILRELKLLRHFNSHENIISILDIMTVPTNKWDFEDIYIVTNLMESDLERIVRSRQVLTDQHFQYFLYQILRALKYVHSANVLHRDLKPSNILVNANCDLAICDFGLARGFHVEGQDTLTEYVVTRWYRAPELLCEAVHYGKGIDVWSVGCIFAELLTHEAFFRGDNPQHQLEVIVNKMGIPAKDKLDFISSSVALNTITSCSSRKNSPPKPFSSHFPTSANPLAIDLLQRMLQFHPDDRVTVEEALAHPYLKEFHGQMPEPTCSQLFDFQFEQVDYDLSAEDVQYLMYTEMLLYRPNSAKFPPPPSNNNLTNGGRRARRRRNSGTGSVTSQSSHNSNGSSSKSSSSSGRNHHRSHHVSSSSNSSSSANGVSGKGGQDKSTHSDNLSPLISTFGELDHHDLADDLGSMSMALESPWGLGLGPGSGLAPGSGPGNRAFFAADSKDDYTSGGGSDGTMGGSFRYETPMQTAREIGMTVPGGGGGGGGGEIHSYAERKDQGPGQGPGLGPGQGQGQAMQIGSGGGVGVGHDSSMGYHSFGTIPSFGSSVMGGSGTVSQPATSMDIDQFLDSEGVVRVDGKDADSPSSSPRFQRAANLNNHNNQYSSGSSDSGYKMATSSESGLGYK